MEKDSATMQVSTPANSNAFDQDQDEKEKKNRSESVIDTITKAENLRTVTVECHGDDTPLTFHDTLLFSLLILLVYVCKFNVHDTLITLPLKLALAQTLNSPHI